MGKTQAKIKRKIVQIDEEKCDGCGLCIMSCAEGALQIVDGKARLVSDKYCDSLGACLGECPRDALSIIEREGEPFYEESIKKHLAQQAPEVQDKVCGCSSAAVLQNESQPSELSHWPVQLTLVPPKAPFLQGADVLLAADCTAFASCGFHQDFLRNHALLVACPKLDDYEAHLAKLTEIFRQSDMRSLTVLRMEVPCCAGLTRMAMQAILSSNKDIPFKEVILTTRGEVKG
jgi:Pyruvate/2-oxoacid:ferredoxin oxidoreductase delta subunit